MIVSFPKSLTNRWRKHLFSACRKINNNTTKIPRKIPAALYQKPLGVYVCIQVSNYIASVRFNFHLNSNYVVTIRDKFGQGHH